MRQVRVRKEQATICLPVSLPNDFEYGLIRPFFSVPADELISPQILCSIGYPTLSNPAIGPQAIVWRTCVLIGWCRAWEELDVSIVASSCFVRFTIPDFMESLARGKSVL